ncbi:MAG: DUF58 domain-containing protein [Thermotaleaceae bacterium]
MTVTKRFLYFVSFGMLVIALTIPFAVSLLAFITYNIVLLLLLLLDYYKTPIKGVFEIEYVGEKKLSLLEDEKICFSIQNKTDQTAIVEVLHELPKAFDYENNRLQAVLLPHAPKNMAVNIIPKKRGIFLLEEVYIRRSGVLGFIKKDIRIDVKEAYKVYPSLKNLKKYHLMLKKDYFFKTGKNMVKREADGREFESLREYVKGDDVKRINWTKSARENKLIVNQYEPENNKHVYILLDTGRTMSYAVNQYTKMDLAINAALFLSDVVCYNKDKSGLLIFNTRVEAFIKPSQGADHRNRILETLYHIEGTRLTSNYEDVLLYLSRQEKRRSLICLFTDIDTVEEIGCIREALRFIHKKHHIILFLIKNEKLESLKRIKLNSRKDLFLKGAAYKMEEERRNIIRILGQSGIHCIECDSEDIGYRAVSAYMGAKNREVV